MLGQRIITAVVLLIALGLSLAAGEPIWFQLLVAAFISVAAWEWYRLLGASGAWGIAAGGLVAGLGFAIYWSNSPAFEPWLFGVAALGWLVAALPALRDPEWLKRVRLLQIVLPVVMLSACLSAAFAILSKLGPLGLVSLLAIVWLADMGAYFAGRALGRRKLAPAISPNKTIEGAVGGLVAVALYVSVLSYLPAGKSLFPAALGAAWGLSGALISLVALAALSITGDLFESLLKRRAGVKDSSHLLPGHGGVLDRIDALVPVLPVAGLMLIYVIN
jgi:phosphatidate cytidylyltransferase